MIPRPRRAAGSGRLVALIAVAGAALAVGLAACSGSAAVSFDPSAECTADAQQAGAYPDLEAELPKQFDGVGPDRLDSGRNCTPGTLGTLAAHGVEELRFAGALFETGSRSGVTLAVFQAPGLTVDRMAQFYETGARSAPKTEQVTTGPYAGAGVDGWRLDTLNDESFQTIVVLDAVEPDRVRAALIASDIREIGTRAAHEAIVTRATNALVAAP
jgi:hypothetical protein